MRPVRFVSPPPVRGEVPRPRFRERLRGSVGYTGKALRLVWGSSPKLLIAFAVLTIIAAALPPAQAYLGKVIIDSVVRAKGLPGAAQAGGLDRALRFVLLELGLVVAGAAVERALAVVRTLLGGRLGVTINVMILEKALTLELRHFEDAEFYDKLTRARRDASTRPLAIVQENFHILRNLLSLAGYAGLLLAFRAWMIPVLVLAAVPSFLAETMFSRAAFRLRNWRSPETRRLNYLEYVLANDQHAKEVKLFALGPVLLGRYRDLASTLLSEDETLARQRALWAYLLSLLSTAAFYACYAVIVYSTVTSHLSLGDMTLYLVAFRGGQQGFQAILASVGGMYEHNLYMSNLFEYLDIPLPNAGALVPAVDATALPAPLPDPAPGTEAGIRFEGVGFRYPGADSWALRGIDLFIPRGASLALVGQNGAGKTTFIKLLTRLYRPTEGRILLDGRALDSWPLETLQRRIGVIFQDFNQYQLLLRENVGVGSVEHLGEDQRILRAIDRGGADAVVERLPQGLDTQLGRWFANGAELSGGQWQKIALARAFMREEADILVLDEPTAALDPEAEHAVFQRFRTLAEGRTTIVISHRFPTVRMADRIVVIERGTIIEQGTHAELLAQAGRYAELFTLQAQGYQ